MLSPSQSMNMVIYTNYGKRLKVILTVNKQIWQDKFQSRSILQNFFYLYVIFNGVLDSSHQGESLPSISMLIQIALNIIFK